VTLPTFVIAGTMKAGTTSLAAWIDAHPQGFVAPVKEVHFFNAADHWDQGMGWYEEHFALAGDARAIGDATPLYSFYPQAIERMAQVLPDARIIMCLRNPIDRAYSHYRHWYYRRVHEDRTWAQVVSHELSAPPSSPPRVGAGAYDRRDPRYLAQGYYLDQLTALLQHYPRERVLPVLTEDLHLAPDETFRQVARFLDIDPECVPPEVGRVENASSYFRPASLWRFQVRHRILERMPNRIATYIALELMQRPLPARPMASDLRQQLVAHFAPRNAKLGAFLERDLSGWR